MRLPYFRQAGMLGLAALLLLVQPSSAVREEDIQWVEVTDPSGNQVLAPDGRRPSLYTGNFGDCLGKSLINVTRFDAAYYKDNMTVLFHLAGTTALQSEALMSKEFAEFDRLQLLTRRSVYRSLCLWRVAFRSHVQSVQCQHQQVRFATVLDTDIH
jgi:hypothetical protein